MYDAPTTHILPYINRATCLMRQQWGPRRAHPSPFPTIC